MTLKATWFTTSGITGFTLPGIIDEPAWVGFNFISPIPTCGPELISLRSLDIFDKFAAKVFKIPETYKNPSKF